MVQCDAVPVEHDGARPINNRDALIACTFTEIVTICQGRIVVRPLE